MYASTMQNFLLSRIWCNMRKTEPNIAFFPINSGRCGQASNEIPLIQLPPASNRNRLLPHNLDRRRTVLRLGRLLVQSQVEAADNRIGVVNGDRPHVGQRLDLGGARDEV